MSEVISAAICLAVETLTKKHGWVNTEATATFTTPFGAVVTIEVKDDTATASVDGVGTVLTVPLSDPEFDTKISQIEAIITNNPKCAYLYARDVLKGPFPAGEAAIAANAQYAYLYAREVLKGPFPAGEAAIAKNAQYAYEYACRVLDGPFPAGEAAIAQSAGYAHAYAYNALMLPEAEARNWRKNYLAKTKRKSTKKGKV